MSHHDAAQTSTQSCVAGFQTTWRHRLMIPDHLIPHHLIPDRMILKTAFDTRPHDPWRPHGTANQMITTPISSDTRPHDPTPPRYHPNDTGARYQTHTTIWYQTVDTRLLYTRPHVRIKPITTPDHYDTTELPHETTWARLSADRGEFTLHVSLDTHALPLTTIDALDFDYAHWCIAQCLSMAVHLMLPVSDQHEIWSGCLPHNSRPHDSSGYGSWYQISPLDLHTTIWYQTSLIPHHLIIPRPHGSGDRMKPDHMTPDHTILALDHMPFHTTWYHNHPGWR